MAAGERDDLFWALRGDGGGNFSVVTSLSFPDDSCNRQGHRDPELPTRCGPGCDLRMGVAFLRLSGGATAPRHGFVAGSDIVDPLDGAIRDVAPGDSAFPWRRHAASAHKAIGQASVGAYVNYIESGVASSRYYATNLSRLGGVRKKYDLARTLYAGLTI